MKPSFNIRYVYYWSPLTQATIQEIDIGGAVEAIKKGGIKCNKKILQELLDKQVQSIF